MPFKVFIGYADLVAVRHATATIADAIRSHTEHFQIHPMLWRFDQLSSSNWRDRAVKAALDADIIVLASSEPSALSPSLEAWVSDFLAANRGHRSTIVAIAGPNDAWTISIEEEKHLAAAAKEPTPSFELTAAEPLFVCSRR